MLKTVYEIESLSSIDIFYIEEHRSRRLGVDQKRLTVRYQGRDFHLIDVYGEFVKPILA